jgi:hypothetical protein
MNCDNSHNSLDVRISVSELVAPVCCSPEELQLCYLASGLTFQITHRNLPLFFQAHKNISQHGNWSKNKVRLFPLKRFNLCGEVKAFELLGYDTALAGSWLPTFQNWRLKMETIGCTETPVTSYRRTERNISEERRPQLDGAANLKWDYTKNLEYPSRSSPGLFLSTFFTNTLKPMLLFEREKLLHPSFQMLTCKSFIPRLLGGGGRNPSAPNISGSSVWNLLHFIPPAPRILRWLLCVFFNLYTPGLQRYRKKNL